MRASRRVRSGLVGAFALALLVACSSPAADGASCESGEDCVSQRCSAGACEGSDCTCDGSSCRSRASCDEGWLCTRGEAVVEDAIPQCRKQCTGVGTCPADKRCENGVCRAGAEAFALTWVNVPRTSACAPRVPCKYEVRSTDPAGIETYTWTFGGAPPIETKEPVTTFTYDVAGTFDVLVRARARTGALAELRTTEVLCLGTFGSLCDPLGSPCCEGTCNAASTCR